MRGSEDQWFSKVFLSLIFIKKSHSFFLSLIVVFFVVYVFSRFDRLDRSVSSEHGFPLSLLSIKKIPDLGDFAKVVTK